MKRLGICLKIFILVFLSFQKPVMTFAESSPALVAKVNTQTIPFQQQRQVVRIAGPCIISTNNNDKLKLYEAVPILKKYYKDPSDSKYVVIRMKPERIRFLAGVGKGYEDIKVPK